VHSAGLPGDAAWPGFPRAPRLSAQQGLEQALVGRVSEAEPAKLLLLEPADGVMLIWLQVGDAAAPAARSPHGEVQAGLRINLVQDRSAFNAFEPGSEFPGNLPPERSSPCSITGGTMP
jgi:hypothetical protein